MSIVYQYGLHAPHEGTGLVHEQLRLAHRFRNTLIEIERGRRTSVRAVESMAGDLPEAMRAHEAAKSTEALAYAQVAKHRAVTRKRDEPELLRAELAAARAAVRAASSHVRAVRLAIKDSLIVQNAKDKIGELAKSLANNAYEYSGCYWGQRAIVVEAAAESFSSLPMYDRAWGPNDPRFLRWKPDGSVGLQIMGGLTAAQLHDCEDSRLRLRPPDARAWSGARSDRRRYGSTAELWLRVGSDGREPRWGKWVCDMDRPLPKGARVVQATVHLRAVGPFSKWRLCLTVDVPAAPVFHPTVGRAVAIDIGWRRVGDDLRVAGWQDDRGVRGELRLDAKMLRELHAPEETRSERDRRFEATRDLVAKLLSESNTLPEEIAHIAQGMKQWKSPARLDRLWSEWQAREPGFDRTLNILQAWHYRDRHLWAREAMGRSQALGHRREIYRIFAARMTEQYEHVLVEKFDKRQLARRPRMGADDDTSPNETARSNRVVAATSELLISLKSACTSRGRVMLSIGAVDTTRICPSCGLVADRKASESIVLRCECGHTWDQDVDGAPSVLLARWSERPSDAEIVVPARVDELSNDSAVSKETRWQRVKRLRREKEARMHSARDVSGNVSE
jgi:hypothetical protein